MTPSSLVLNDFNDSDVKCSALTSKCDIYITGQKFEIIKIFFIVYYFLKKSLMLTKAAFIVWIRGQECAVETMIYYNSKVWGKKERKKGRNTSI